MKATNSQESAFARAISCPDGKPGGKKSSLVAQALRVDEKMFAFTVNLVTKEDIVLDEKGKFAKQVSVREARENFLRERSDQIHPYGNSSLIDNILQTVNSSENRFDSLNHMRPDKLCVWLLFLFLGVCIFAAFIARVAIRDEKWKHWATPVRTNRTLCVCYVYPSEDPVSIREPSSPSENEAGSPALPSPQVLCLPPRCHSFSSVAKRVLLIGDEGSTSVLEN